MKKELNYNIWWMKKIQFKLLLTVNSIYFIQKIVMKQKKTFRNQTKKKTLLYFYLFR